jgi:hypothetical protein
VGQSPEAALQFLEGLAQGAGGTLGRRLKARQHQIQGLMALRKANRAFREQKGRSPSKLEDLVGYGGLKRLPRDPFGEGYALTDDGRVRIRLPRPLRDDYEKPRVKLQ